MFGPSKRQLYRDNTRQREHYERIIADLHDRLADAHGRPWTLAPADTAQTAELEKVASIWTATPEQDAL